MASVFELAMAAGLAVASVHALFARRDGRSWRAAARTFLGWLLAFAIAGYLTPLVGAWLLANVF